MFSSCTQWLQAVQSFRIGPISNISTANFADFCDRCTTRSNHSLGTRCWILWVIFHIPIGPVGPKSDLKWGDIPLGSWILQLIVHNPIGPIEQNIDFKWENLPWANSTEDNWNKRTFHLMMIFLVYTRPGSQVHISTFTPRHCLKAFASAALHRGRGRTCEGLTLRRRPLVWAPRYNPGDCSSWMGQSWTPAWLGYRTACIFSNRLRHEWSRSSMGNALVETTRQSQGRLRFKKQLQDFRNWSYVSRPDQIQKIHVVIEALKWNVKPMWLSSL